MKRRMSHLDLMRAARDQREQAVLAPIVTPLKRDLQATRAQNRDMQEALDALSRIVTSSVAPCVYEDIREQIAERVRQLIFDAMAQAPSPVNEIITVRLAAAEVRFCRPDDVAKQILDKAARHYLAKAQGLGLADRVSGVATLQVVLPKTTINVEVPDTSPRRRHA